MYSPVADGSKRRRSKTRSFNNLDLVSRSTGALPRRNLSTSMTLLDLREGMFSAEIPLNAFSTIADVTVKVTHSPCRGQGRRVTVKVIDSSLELYVNDDAAAPASRDRDVRGQRSNEGDYRGTIDLPNYVDSGQVQFDVVGQTLCVKATMKGNPQHLISPPLSVSNGVRVTVSVSNVRSSSTLDLSCLQRRSSRSATRRREALSLPVSACLSVFLFNCLCLSLSVCACFSVSLSPTARRRGAGSRRMTST